MIKYHRKYPNDKRKQSDLPGRQNEPPDFNWTALAWAILLVFGAAALVGVVL